MRDNLTTDQRFRAMSANRGRTRPERTLASALWRRGLRYLTANGYRRVYGRGLDGNPDIIFPARRVAIFVDGCFWHGCPVCRKSEHASAFWRTKITANMERDRRVTDALKQRGWVVVGVPEHALRPRARLQEAADALADFVRTSRQHDTQQGSRRSGARHGGGLLRMPEAWGSLWTADLDTYTDLDGLVLVTGADDIPVDGSAATPSMPEPAEPSQGSPMRGLP